MSRPRWLLRDAALSYASRGIPVLPLHHPLPLPHRGDLQPVAGDQPLALRTGCSCRDPDCGQAAKHPLGSLVPHGVNDATCNRARILTWWTRHPQANIGLACGQRFDVLDVDGPAGAQAIRTLAATHGLQNSGPLVRTGGGGWHYYLAPTGLGNASPAGLAHVDWRGRGGYVVAPPSPTPPATPTGGSSAAISTPRWPRSRHRCESGWNADRRNDRLVRRSFPSPASIGATTMRGQP